MTCSSRSWGYDYENRSNIVEVYIRYVREKIDRPFGRNSIADGQRSRLPRLRRGIAPDYQPADLQRWLRRLPIRWRLTLMFAAVMAVLLAGLIAFLYFHFRSDLDYNINQGLRARAQDIAGLVRQQDAQPTRAARCGSCRPAENNVVQVLDEPGGCSAPAPARFSPPLLIRSEIRRGSRRRQADPAGNAASACTRCRSPMTTRSSSPACRLADRDAALDKLDDALAIGVPPALLLATLAAYLLAAAALRPVERMRSRAATISTDRDQQPGCRCPRADDEIRRLGVTLNEMLDRLEEGLEHERHVRRQRQP